MDKERKMREKQLRTCGAITMLVTAALIFSALVYYQVVSYLTREDRMLLPESYRRIAKHVEGRYLGGGVHVVHIGDAYSKDDSFSLNVPVGHFNEIEGSYAVGISGLIATGLQTLERADNNYEFNQTLSKEPQATTWTSLSDDLVLGLDSFWKEFMNVQNLIKVQQTVDMMTYA